MYINCALIQNAHFILYQSIGSDWFEINALPLDQYFIYSRHYLQQ